MSASHRLGKSSVGGWSCNVRTFTKKNMQPTYQPNAKLDLSFTRVVNVPRTLVWRAWTEPDLLKPWFCPLPWKTIACEIDLRPGGVFRTTMQSPGATHSERPFGDCTSGGLAYFTGR